MTCSTLARAAGPGALSRIAISLGCYAKRYVRHRSLAKLNDLDDRLLRDIGLTRADIDQMRRHW